MAQLAVSPRGPDGTQRRQSGLQELELSPVKVERQGDSKGEPAGYDDEEEDYQKDYHAHVINISDRLTQLQINLEEERNFRFDHLNAKMVAIGERLETSKDAAVLKYKGLKENLLAFQKETVRMRTERGELAERKTEEIRSLEERLQALLEQEQQACRHSEQRIVSLFEVQTGAVKKQITKEEQSRQSYEGNLRRYLEFDIPKMTEALREEVASREAMEMRIVKSATAEIQALEEEVCAEKKAREDTEEAMLRMMEDLVSKMQGDIANERRDRAKKEQFMMNLLELTCEKLQTASQSL